MSERAPRSHRRLAFGALAGLAASFAAWHASPVVLWHWRLESQLARQGEASRMHTVTWTELPQPSRAWTVIRSGAITLHAPLAAEALPACGRCDGDCRLPLDNRGTVAIFEEGLPAEYEHVFDRHAPDARDLSLLRSVRRNWQTIDALTDRVRARSTPPRSFRFEASGSRGVVSEFLVDGVTRYVVYAYSRQGAPARLVGVAGLGRERFRGLLGGLAIEPEHAARPSRCTPPRLESAALSAEDPGAFDR